MVNLVKFNNNVGYCYEVLLLEFLLVFSYLLRCFLIFLIDTLVSVIAVLSLDIDNRNFDETSL